MRQKRPRTKYLWDIGMLFLGMLFLGVGIALMGTEIWPSMYWVGVMLVYGGSLALAVHIVKEDEFLPNKTFRRTIAVAILLAVWWVWSAKVVFANAEVNSADIANYPTGTNVGGIAWEDEFVDVWLSLSNSTDNDYKDLDIFATSDITVMAASQLSNLPDVTILDNDETGVSDIRLYGADANGKATAFPMTGHPLNLAKPTGIRLLCGKLPKRTSRELIMASAALNYRPPPLPERLFAAKRLPRRLAITGTYRALGQTRSINIVRGF